MKAELSRLLKAGEAKYKNGRLISSHGKFGPHEKLCPLKILGP